MVFSSIPPYLDPSNWHQQQSYQISGSSSIPPIDGTTSAVTPPPPPPNSLQPHGGVGSGSIRPGSMSERARLANIPMPESALKCPRCESTNTKFCYFNNYNLTQPRHFCKTCRRYWTRGGALRNVPVGGGCRRNKRSKSAARSKSPASSDRQTMISTSSTAESLLGLTPPQIPNSQQFVSPLGQICGDNFMTDMSLNYTGISAPGVGNTNGMNFHGGGIDGWRLQQFPLFGGLDPSPAGIYQFHGGESAFVESSQQLRPKFSSSLMNELAVVKMEETRKLGGNDQWNGNGGWTEVSSFSSSSTSNPLQHS